MRFKGSSYLGISEIGHVYFFNFLAYESWRIVRLPIPPLLSHLSKIYSKVIIVIILFVLHVFIAVCRRIFFKKNFFHREFLSSESYTCSNSVVKIAKLDNKFLTKQRNN